MTRHEHESAVDRLYRAHRSRWLWQSTWLPLLRGAWWAVVVAAVVLTATWAASNGCGDLAWADEPPDAEAVALSHAALAWDPEALPRAATVRAVAAQAVLACHEIVGTALGPDCPALLMALAHRESRWRPGVTGRRPWRAVGVYQLHGAALDTWSREEARDLRRNTRLAADWLRQCAVACGNVEKALGMYARGVCERTWGTSLLLRQARELRAAGGGRP